MKKSELKLEVLKLVYRHDRTEAQVIDRARLLEKYIFEEDSSESEEEVSEPAAQEGDQNSSESKAQGDKRSPKKKTGNLASLI